MKQRSTESDNQKIGNCSGALKIQMLTLDFTLVLTSDVRSHVEGDKQSTRRIHFK